MFIDERPGSFPPEDGGELFYVGPLSPLEEEADDDLIAALGRRLEEYDFRFFEAAICSFHADAGPTHSWVEVAFCRQLASACVLWKSGVSPLRAPRSYLYGWMDCRNPNDVDEALRIKAKARGVPLRGFHRDYEEYLATVARSDIGTDGDAGHDR